MDENGMGTSPKTEIIKSISLRMLAVFVASGLGVLGAGAVVGIDVVSAVLMAGILGVASVLERLARAFLDDGKLTAEEIDSVFHQASKKIDN
ncbi:MAG: hypothetical protein WAO41_08705 [Candidatus Nanopelagicales bacterium]